MELLLECLRCLEEAERRGLEAIKLEEEEEWFFEGIFGDFAEDVG